MRIKLAIAMLILIAMTMIGGCGKSKNDIFVDNYKFYIGVSDYWDISAFNDCKCVDYKIVKDEDSGNYTVTFEFKKFGVTLCR